MLLKKITAFYSFSILGFSFTLHLFTMFICLSQRAKVKTTTPITPELFFQWKKKKMDERDAGLAAQQAERAKNDRMRFLDYSYS